MEPQCLGQTMRESHLITNGACANCGARDEHRDMRSQWLACVGALVEPAPRPRIARRVDELVAKRTRSTANMAKLDEHQEAAIVACLRSGIGVNATARKLGLARETVRRRKVQLAKREPVASPPRRGNVSGLARHELFDLVTAFGDRGAAELAGITVSAVRSTLSAAKAARACVLT